MTPGGPMPGAIVDTRSGKIQGRERDGVQVFLGIPYAAAPVGDRRWRPPVPEEPWEGVRDATAFGPESAQGAFALAQMLGGGETNQSENSLHLNVWTPGLDDARRPVLVWIHGGAFMNGSGSTPWYSGTRFARNGCVLVTINYRLGAFGFLHLAERFDLPGSGNLGLSDQAAALEWVRDNIAAFGGDPDNVTIFGESAGGASVGSLLGMPRARGLFAGAAAQSGAASWIQSTDEADAFCARFLAALDVAPGDTEALLAAPTERVLAAQATAVEGSSRAALPFRPVLDGVVFPEPPLDAVAAGHAAGVRLMLGTNRHEMTLFHLWDPGLADLDQAGVLARARARLGDDAPAIVAGYRAHHPELSATELWRDLSTDFVFRIPAIRLAEAQLPHGPVWSYLFTWETPVFGGGLRSTHALEIPFVFDAVHQRGSVFFTGDGPERAELADAMHRAWVAFASGDPAHPGIPPWPRYDLDRRATMRFDTTCEVLDDPDGADRRLWESSGGVALD